MDKGQSNFAAGEVSPEVGARVDLDRYQMGLKTLRNAYVTKRGGITNRSGTVVCDSLFVKTVLWKFRGDEDSSYAIAFSEQKIRIIRNGKFITEPTFSISGVTSANPGVFTTSSAHGYTSGDYVVFKRYADDGTFIGKVGLEPTVDTKQDIENTTFIVTVLSATTFSLNIVLTPYATNSGLTAYTSGGAVARVKTLTTPYFEEHLDELKFDQTGDVITITHPLYPPAELFRGPLGEYDWTFRTITFAPESEAPTRLYTQQDYAVSVVGALAGNNNNGSLGAIAATGVATGTIQARIMPHSARMEVGDRVWISGVAQPTEMNGKWMVSRTDPGGDNNDVWLCNSDGSTIDMTAWLDYTTGGTMSTKEKEVYRVTSVLDGEESLASADATRWYSYDPQTTAPVTIKWTPPALDATGLYIPDPQYKSFNVYKLDGGRYGYIGVAQIQERTDVATNPAATAITAASPPVLSSVAHGLTKGQRIYFHSGYDAARTITGVSKASLTITGISKANPAVVTTSVAHGLTVGDRVTITGITADAAWTALNGIEYTVYSTPTATTFGLSNASGATIDTSGFAGTWTAGGSVYTGVAVVTTGVAHGLSVGNRVKIKGITADAAFMALNDREYLVYSVPSATLFGIADLDNDPIDTSGFAGTWTAGGTVGIAHEFNGLTFQVGGNATYNGTIAADSFGLYRLDTSLQGAPTVACSDGKFRISDWVFEDNGIVPSVTDTAPPQDANNPFLTKKFCNVVAASKTNPVVITTQNEHNLFTGDVVKLESLGGMTEVNGYHYLVTYVDAHKFSLQSRDGADVDGTAYTTYTSGGTITLCDFPSCVCTHQQRRIFAGMRRRPAHIVTTQTGNLYNMNASIPARSDDALIFQLPVTRGEKIVGLVSAKDLVITTTGGEWISSSGDGSYTIDNIQNLQQSDNGSAVRPQPLAILNTILYVQSIGNSIWDMGYRFETDSYMGEERTIMSSHLFEGKNIVAWEYQHHPSRLLWVVLDDGTLLSMTYMPEQRIWGWSRHDTTMNARAISLASVREGDDDVLYVVFARYYADGQSTPIYFIERFMPRDVLELEDQHIMDFGYVYNQPMEITAVTDSTSAVVSVQHFAGFDYTAPAVNDIVEIDDTIVTPADLQGQRYRIARLVDNSPQTIDGYIYKDYDMTLVSEEEVTSSGRNISGITQANPGVVTTSTAHGLTAGDVIRITGVAGMTQVNNLFFKVGTVPTTTTFQLQTMAGVNLDTSAYTAYSSAGLVEEFTPLDTSAMDFYTRGGYLRVCRNTFTGAYGLQNRTVTILADGDVTTHDETDSIPTGFRITLANSQYAARIHAGIAYTSDVETLTINDPGSRLTGKQKHAARIVLSLLNSRGMEAGRDSATLEEIKQREYEGFGSAIGLQSGDYVVSTRASTDYDGHVFVRQELPLPMHIVGVRTQFDVGDMRS